MGRYKIADMEVSSTEPGFAELVEMAYKEKIRPLCMCREGGVEMYISHFESGYFIKRMPDSAEEHTAICDSFESAAVLSGRGEVDGSAIQTDDEGQVNIKLAFSLRRNAAMEQATGETENLSATATGSRLTLRGFLHYLWDEAKLTYWSPEKEKLTWPDVREVILKAVEEKETKNSPLAEVLYIPESYDPMKGSEIAHRRTRQLAPIMGKGNYGKKLMVLVGEMDRFAPARYGHALWIKQLNDLPFQLSDDLYKKFDKLFKPLLGLWDLVPKGHMMVICTFVADQNGLLEVQELALMLTDEYWIPIENQHDRDVMSIILVPNQRTYQKMLRYNLTTNKPIASYTLLDVEGDPVPMYLDLIDLFPSWAPRESILELIEASKLPHWLWNPMEGTAPPLPPKAIAPEHMITESDSVPIEAY